MIIGTQGEDWVDIKAGADFVIAKQERTVWSWGNNTYGQLGDNTTTSKKSPVSISFSNNEVDITAGGYFGAVRKKSDGLVYLWGRNDYGQLGKTISASQSVPVSVSTPDSFIQVANGYYYTLAIRGSDGRLFAWGYNLYGHLGDNSTTSRSIPVSVSTADSFVKIAAGGDFSLAIRGSDGRLFAWGYNGYGQLGDNTRTNRSIPVSVSSTDSFVKIAAGQDFSLAIRGSDERLFVWGNNTYGQLGDNTTTSRSVPVSVSSTDSFINVVGGENYSLAIRGSDGILFAWGKNDYGELGTQPMSAGDGRNVPGSVCDSNSFTTIVNNKNYGSLTIRGSDGRLFAWGYNSDYQLGNGNSSHQIYPISVATADSFVKIAFGYMYSSAAIRGSDGRLFAWGYNQYGNVGDNSTTQRTSPVSVSTADSFIQIVAGSDNQLLTIRGSDGRLFAWGNNTYGQLGDNTRTNRSVPVSVSTADSFVQVAAGTNSLAIRGSDGRLFAWGYNGDGQLGDNSTTSRSVPVSVSTTDSFVQISGGNHSLAIRGDGRLFAWGRNADGQLGDNTTTNRSVPVSVSSTDSFVKITCGANHSLAIRGSDGRLFAWGQNLNGQLGRGDSTYASVPVSVSTTDSFVQITAGSSCSFATRGSDGRLFSWGQQQYYQLGYYTGIGSISVPTSISSAVSWTKVETKSKHTLAINGSDGRLFSWGRNDYGQLGNNSTTSSYLPISVSTSDSFLEIICGYYYSIGIRADGRLFAWGRNDSGVLGDNTRTNRSAPISVFTTNSFVQVSGFIYHSLAIRGSDGKLFAWGNNQYGQLGWNDYYTSISTPILLDSSSYSNIICGSTHTMGLKGDGSLYAWGNNTYGQLGDNSRESKFNPVSVYSTDSWKAAACGESHTIAIRNSDGLAYAWGLDNYGQLGVNPFAAIVSRSIPNFTGNNFQYITTGENFALAIRGDGRLFAWGANIYGNLGDNTTTGKSYPFSVSTSDSFVQIIGGKYHTIAIRGDGRLFTWGYNGYGQLGDNSLTNRSVPGSVSTTDSFVQVNYGDDHSVAIRGSDGRLFAWGRNNYGNLGDNTTTNKSVPVSVSTSDSFVQIAGGESYSLALRGDGRLFAWGRNTYGQLGTNNTTSYSVPVSVSTSDSFIQISAGSNHVIAIRGSDGRLFAWGDNVYGDLGDNSTISVSYPISVSTTDSFVQIASGQLHSLALRCDGRLFAWGYNGFGELGDNTTTSRSVPVSVSTADSFVKIACYSFSLALRYDGQLFSWGKNNSGQLGDFNVYTSKSQPYLIASTDSWKMATAGQYHTTAIRGSDGLAFAWGYNNYGQLGAGKLPVGSRSVPYSVSTSDSFIKIGGGSGFSISIKSDGRLFAWGYNGEGELGVNSAISYSAPVSVSTSDSFIQIGVGHTHLLAIRGSDGRLFSWGYNLYGPLGDNSTTSRSVPVSVSTSDSFIQVDACYNYSAAIRGSDGRLFSWGNNTYGQLGDNTTTSKSIPISVSTSDSFIQISGAENHITSIRGSDGRLFAWGRNNYGQLGDNTTTNKSVPVSVSTSDSFIIISNSTDCSLAIRGDGRLFVWGSNTYGQLGDNTTTSKSIPVSVSSSDSFVQVAAGYYHSLAIRGSDGRLFAWGRNNYGQLGNNSTTSRSVPVSVYTSDSFIQIACGDYHSLAIRGSDSKVFIWGANDYGQLGVGDDWAGSVKIPISIPSINSWKIVANGQNHTLAIRGSDGRLFSWGYNNYGQLGDNTLNYKISPVSVNSSLSFIAIACGNNNSYGIDSNRGVWAWGDNTYGQIGINLLSGSQSIPVSVEFTSSFTKVVEGQYFTLAIRGSDGRLFSWGHNQYGQLGDNSTTSRSLPVSVYNTDSFIDVACGESHSVAIRNSDGRLYAWGNNSYGQLGDNSITSRSIPVSVYNTDSFVKVACGQYYTTAIKSDGSVYAWGRNDYGQLGDNYNNGTSKSIPVQIFSSENWKVVVGGGAHTTAIKDSNGLLYAWGSNTYGQLGDNSRTNRILPVSISSSDSWVKVANGLSHTIAIKGSDGSIYGWGRNDYGQLGKTTSASQSVPVSVSTGDSFVTIAGTYPSVALTIRGSDGRLFAWGDNTYGQLGDNTKTNKSVPVSVSSSDSFVQTGTGEYYSIAMRGDGRLFAWGGNYYGQLGDNTTTDKSIPISVSSADSFVKVAGGRQQVIAIRGSDGRLFAWGYNTYGNLGDNTTTSRSVPVSVSSADSFIQVAGCDYFTVAIRGSDGRLFAWGYNTYGNLGDNTTTAKSVPVSVSTSDSFKLLGAGNNHVIAIRGSDGRLFTWGDNTYSQLGNNTTGTSYSVPISVSSTDSFVNVAGGQGQSVAIRGSDGRLFAWGRNLYGEVGDNSRTTRSYPVSVSTSDSFVKVACGQVHCLAIRGNGLLYAWGNNGSGQLGWVEYSYYTSVSIPVLIDSSSWKAVGCGLNYTAAIKGSNGLAYAWGDNTYGQLGDNTRTSIFAPTLVTSIPELGGSSWIKISGGHYHSLAIRRSDGRLFAWGGNDYGELGNNTSGNSYSVPVSVSTSDSFVAVAGGYYHSLAIRGSDGRVFAWGGNTGGALGDNSTTSKSVPVSVSTTDSFVQVACGVWRSLAIRGSDGRLFAWGGNTEGQLGDNTRTNRSVPVSVSSADSFVKIICDGHSLAIRGSDGRLFAWGYNASGQLGDNTKTSKSVPVSVSSADSFVQISVGSYNSYAIRGSDGRIFAWGNNTYGQLGDNTTTGKSIPISVSTADSFIKISTDKDPLPVTLAQRGDGRLFSWGYNGNGQLGDNSLTPKSYPVSVSTSDSFIEVACGRKYTLATRGVDGKIFTWGINESGQLGDNTIINKSVPVSVSNGTEYYPSNWKDIYCGDNHTIAIRNSDGLAFAWGSNTYGQLGDNTVVSKSNPVSISSADSWKSIFGGSTHTAAIRGSDGKVFSWGYNNYGQLGVGKYPTATRSVPFSISTSDSFVQVADGGGTNSFTLAIRGDGRLFAWGSNSSGQLGTNNTTSYSVPVSVSSSDSFIKIACGNNYSLAIRGSDGRLFGWGYNSSSNLGDNSATNRSVPISVSTADSFVQVACGLYHTFALRGDGRLFAWGSNSFGELGDNSQTAKSVPVSVSSADSFKYITSYNFHSSAIRGSDGKVFAWGNNTYGNIGDNSTTSKSVPVSVSSTDSFVIVEAGAFFSLAIRGDGRLFGWGSSSYGELGNNTRSSYSVPISVSTADSFVKISVELNAALAIRGDGRLFTWGKNDWGQLGNNTSGNSYSYPVSISSSDSFIQVAQGDYHSSAIRGSDGRLFAWGYSYAGLGVGDDWLGSIAIPISVALSDSFKEIVCGYNHTAGIKASDGTIYSWGRNQYGELGDNTIVNKLSPTLISADSFKTIGAGGQHTIAVKGSNNLGYAWGLNSSGQLGDYSSLSKSIPNSVLTPDSFSQVACGESHTSAIRGSDGKVFAWGRNTYGQLGDNTTTSRLIPTSISSTDSFVKIATGQYFTEAIRGSDGLVYAWGRNDYGQLGKTNSASQSIPVSMNLNYTWINIIAVGNQSGGQYGAIGIRNSDGRLFAWGGNSQGQLGDNTKTSKSVPVSVSTSDSFTQISSENLHVMAIRGSDGRLFSWGYNGQGQLGDNSTTGQSVPVSVSTTDSFTQVVAANSYTLALREDGRLFAWGRNNEGELGDNSTTNKSVPVSVSSADSFIQITGFIYHSLAIRGSDGRLFAWGRNTHGQLGDNSTTDKSVPVSVSTSDSFVQISSGTYHSLAIRGSDGRLFAWGDNTYGQLGDSTTTSKSVPISVSTADSFIKVACGSYYTMAIRGNDGKLFAWGINDYGQLGDNSIISRSIPVSVYSSDSWKQVSCDHYHTIAINGNNKTFAWGRNDFWQLGFYEYLSSYSYPVCIDTNSYKEITCGLSHTAAIKGNDGRLYAWGDNTYGQLGDNTRTSRFSPILVSNGDSFVTITAGNYHTLGIKGSNGLIYAWGHNQYGQLGINTSTKLIPVLMCKLPG